MGVPFAQLQRTSQDFAVASLGRLDFGLFALVYSMTGFPLVLVLAVLRGWRSRAAEPN